MELLELVWGVVFLLYNVVKEIIDEHAAFSSLRSHGIAKVHIFVDLLLLRSVVEAHGCRYHALELFFCVALAIICTTIFNSLLSRTWRSCPLVGIREQSRIHIIEAIFLVGRNIQCFNVCKGHFFMDLLNGIKRHNVWAWIWALFG